MEFFSRHLNTLMREACYAHKSAAQLQHMSVCTARKYMIYVGGQPDPSVLGDLEGSYSGIVGIGRAAPFP